MTAFGQKRTVEELIRCQKTSERYSSGGQLIGVKFTS